MEDYIEIKHDEKRSILLVQGNGERDIFIRYDGERKTVNINFKALELYKEGFSDGYKMASKEAVDRLKPMIGE